MIEHQEGNANFKANLSGKDKGPGKIKGVFYNPSMKFSRDLNVEFAKKLRMTISNAKRFKRILEGNSNL